jgi:hypothetical protein
VIVECAVYEEGQRRPGELQLDQACEAGQEDGAVVWIDLYEPTPQEFRAIREELSLHPLAIEDAIEAHQRPKVERYGDQVFIVLKSARYVDETEDVVFGEVMLFAGPWRSRAGSPSTSCRTRASSGASPWRTVMTKPCPAKSMTSPNTTSSVSST